MNHGIFIGLVYNAALLMALGIVFDSITLRNFRSKALAKIISGFCLGSIALAIMLNPFVLRPGVVFDTRSILLSLTAMFFGIVPTSIAALMALAFRIWQGGAGVYMGCSVILASVLWGYLWKRKHKEWDKPYKFGELYLLGIGNHITMLILTSLLPKAIRSNVFNAILIPVIVIYPLVTVYLGLLIGRRIQRRKEKYDLEESEKQFRNLYDNAPMPNQSLDSNGIILSVNQAWLKTLGYSLQDVAGKEFTGFIHQDSLNNFITHFPTLIAEGQIESCELLLIKRDGLPILVSFNGKVVYNEDGSINLVHCVFTNITERRKQEAALKSIEWMLSKQTIGSGMQASYGDLTALNTNRLILDSVGKDVLYELVSDYLQLMDTSSAVYEKNGDYAIGIFSSAWCHYLDEVSRKLCETDDNAVALSCGMWHCHESCWTDVSKRAIETGEIIDLECNGGIHLYAVPIKTSTEIIGVINLGYGAPPQDESRLNQIADKYKVEVSKLKQNAALYLTRPPYIIDQAKRKLQTAAKIIGEIVERKQAELELEKVSLLQQAILSSVPDIIMQVDNNKVYTWANTQGFDFFGDDVIGKAADNFFVKEQQTYSIVQPLFSGDEHVIYVESWQRRKDGVERLLAWWCKVLRNENGEVTGALSSARDITDQRLAEEEYNSFFTNALDLFCIADTDGYFRRLNKSWEQILGYKISELENKRFLDYVHPDDLPSTLDAIAKLSNQYEIASFINRYRHKDGSYRWIEWRSYPSGDRIYAAARDITELKTAHDELVKIKQDWEIFFQTIPHPVYILDKEQNIIAANAVLENALGMTTEQMKGKKCWELMHGNGCNEPPPGCPFAESCSQDSSISGEMEVEALNGFYYVSSKPIFDKDGKIDKVIHIAMDITDRKKAEEVLAESEAKYRSLVESSDSVIAMFDINGIVKFGNIIAASSFNLSEDEIIGKSHFELFPPDIAEFQMNLIMQVIRTGQSITTESCSEVAGKKFWYHTSICPVLDVTGKPYMAVVNATDITSIKSAEQALKESEDRFIQFMNYLPGGAFISDKDSKAIFVNRYLLEKYGEQGGLGSSPLNTFPPDVAEELIKDDRKALEQGYSHSEETVTYPDGTTHINETIKFAIKRDNADTLLGGIILEVTERKMAEEERNLYAQRLEILHDIDTGILEARSLEQICRSNLEALHRLLPSFRCSIVVWGETKEEWLLHILEDGVYKTKTLTNNPVDFTEDLLAGSIFYIPNVNYYQSELSEYRQNLVKQGIISHLHIPLIMKGEFFGTINFGDKVATEYSPKVLDTLKEIASQMTIAIQQMHLTKEIEHHAEELELKVEERTIQLKNANKELESFSYTVAHDLRSPLRSIDGFANILLEDYADKLDDEGKRKLDVIKNNASKMDILIKELLELAKLNPYSLRYKLLDMNEIINNVIDALLSADIRAQFTIDVATLPPVMADYTLIEQVWQNLLANAIKFTLPKEVKKINIGWSEKENEYLFFIKDSGVGFDMKYVDKIFGPFQRLHKTQEFEGTGIGLAIVSKIIQRHNGKIWAESEIGKGSAFYFSLPVRSE